MTKYEAVAQAIKNDIENGLYKEGQPIPTEELLTAQYDVSRQTPSCSKSRCSYRRCKQD